MRKLVVIDDEEDIRQVVSLTLEAVGNWTVNIAGSGAEGIAIIIKRHFLRRNQIIVFPRKTLNYYDEL